MNPAPTRIVIVGRDVSLWLSACVLQSALTPLGVQLHVLELPTLLRASDVCASSTTLEALHHRLRIDESRLLRAVRGAFSLGQNFIDLAGDQSSFFHPYGACGAPIDHRAFLPYWLMARTFGLKVALEEFSLTAVAAKQGRMLIPDAATDVYGRADYAYHLPALEYAAWLKQLATKRGVRTYQALKTIVETQADRISAVNAIDFRVEGDLFIDATGSAGDLMSALGVQRQSWREYFRVDRKLVASAARLPSIPPYAEIRSSSNGWIGLYPTQVRTHVVHAYASAFATEEQALIQATRASRFALHDVVVEEREPARSQSAWSANCIALGDAACSFDPVHSVELQALQLGLVHLLSLFPVSGEHESERAEYNRVCQLGYERLRDFQSAHYACNRYVGDFWESARQAQRSSLLQHKIDLFHARGEVPMVEHESFTTDSWQSLLIGHGLLPHTYEPAIERTPPTVIKQEFRRILSFIKDKVQEQTTHDEYLQALCS